MIIYLIYLMITHYQNEEENKKFNMKVEEIACEVNLMWRKYYE